MDKSLNQTPVASRTHIGFFGRMNAGKSSLINALADQQVSIVSTQPGTTTDVVKKTMEIHGIGPCVLLDTAGFDDEGTLGRERTEASLKASSSTDIAVLVMKDAKDLSMEAEWAHHFAAKKIPVVAVLTHADRRTREENQALGKKIQEAIGMMPLSVSCAAEEKMPDGKRAEMLAEEESSGIQKGRPGNVKKNGTGLNAGMDDGSVPVFVNGDKQSSALLTDNERHKGIDALKAALTAAAGRLEEKPFILGNLVKNGDVVLLVMPQDPQAPQGRLILPEVQTIRECLNRKCIAICTQPSEMENALQALGKAPDLIITDSQVFDEVYTKMPEGSKLTSFSVLFAGYKGDMDYYLESVKKIGELKEDSRVLIAECCTHAPLDEDIGRVKIPAMLRKRIGQGLTVDVTAGNDFPEDAGDYDLIIQCGGCMLNRRAVCSRIEKAKEAGVSMTNYGITIAYLKGILDKVVTGR